MHHHTLLQACEGEEEPMRRLLCQVDSRRSTIACRSVPCSYTPVPLHSVRRCSMVQCFLSSTTTTTNRRHNTSPCTYISPVHRLLDSTGHQSGLVTLWNGLCFNFEQPTQTAAPVRSMKWSHDRQWMLTCDSDGTAS